MPSIFTRIINGEIPCYKVAENETCLAFLDIAPLKKGHVLVVPKTEVDNIFDLDSKSYSQLFTFAQGIAKAIQKSISCKRVSLQVIGLEVPHAHIHLIPINSMNDCDFKSPKLVLSQEEFQQIATTIGNIYTKQSA